MRLRFLSTALLLAAGFGLAAAPASARCTLEASTGVGITQDKLASGGTIDLSQVGGMLGAGGGCDLIGGGVNAPFFGVMGRYSWMHVTGDIGSATLKSDQLWELAARAGYKWHDKFAPYIMAGWSGMNLDLPSGLGDKKPNGLMLGGGVDLHLAGANQASPWWLRAEYAWHHFGKEDVGGADLKSDLHVARLAIVYAFGDREPVKPLK